MARSERHDVLASMVDAYLRARDIRERLVLLKKLGVQDADTDAADMLVDNHPRGSPKAGWP